MMNVSVPAHCGSVVVWNGSCHDMHVFMCLSVVVARLKNDPRLQQQLLSIVNKG